METAEDMESEICTLTNMSPSELNDFYALSYDQQLQTLENYRLASKTWVRELSTLERVGNILTALGALAGAVSGVATAGSAVRAFTAAL